MLPECRLISQGVTSLEGMQKLDGHNLSRKVMAGVVTADNAAGHGGRPAFTLGAPSSGFIALGSAQLGGLQGTAGGDQLDNTGYGNYMPVRLYTQKDVRAKKEVMPRHAPQFCCCNGLRRCTGRLGEALRMKEVLCNHLSLMT